MELEIENKFSVLTKFAVCETMEMAPPNKLVAL